MKKLGFLALLSLSFSVLANPVHLDLEMTSEEYREILGKMPSTQKSLTADLPAITEALRIGDRLSKWIALVNTNRSPQNAIRLTSPETRRGIPIDKPNVYSPKTIELETRLIMNEIPGHMKGVLLGNGNLPLSLGMDDNTFIKHARRIDRNYQSAARFKSIDQYRSEYIRAANKDVRGFYYLQTNNITADQLKDTDMIPAEQLGSIKEALVQICMNGTGRLSKCKKDVHKAASQNKLDEIYNRYIKAAQSIWNGFFKIPSFARRHDLIWKGQVATVPFNTPKIEKFIPYLKNNIEEEFQWKGWALKIAFGNFPNGPVLIFRPGVVPHVNGLGGNEIVMDSNQPIEEYESQWTIRHEFGHVIGLPDCYHEFYDVQTDTYVNYQLDITDLMCSRAGNMNERIYLELKNAYQ